MDRDRLGRFIRGHPVCETLKRDFRGRFISKEEFYEIVEVEVDSFLEEWYAA